MPNPARNEAARVIRHLREEIKHPAKRCYPIGVLKKKIKDLVTKTKTLKCFERKGN